MSVGGRLVVPGMFTLTELRRHHCALWVVWEIQGLREGPGVPAGQAGLRACGMGGCQAEDTAHAKTQVGSGPSKEALGPEGKKCEGGVT